VQRTVAAPFKGYIGEARARAGDIVREGQVLATLDDRELRLERLKAASQQEQLTRQYQQAMAARDAAQVRILAAQIEQTRAQVALLDEELARTRVTAPFDGVIVIGDLSQSLGAPVDTGQQLFLVAPLEAYRVILEIDEREIADVRVGQHGKLMLSAFPGEPMPVEVRKVTPVSVAREGRNYFRVEAGLEHPSERMRPGMAGVGKIDADRRLLVWIWTHQVLDWVRLNLWAWLP